MVTIANTKENNAIVKALKKINECQWVGNVRHTTLDKCMTAINYSSGKNSGWYIPTVTRIAGLTGMYMINEDGSICFDYRVIKEDEKQYLIEEMTTRAYNEFEKLYLQFINEE